MCSGEGDRESATNWAAAALAGYADVGFALGFLEAGRRDQ